MPKRVLIISDYGWRTGGTEEFVRALADNVLERWPTEVLTWSTTKAPLPSGVEVTVVDNGDALQVWSAVARADAVVIVTSFNMRMLARTACDALLTMSTPALAVVQTSAHSSPASAAAPVQARWLARLVERSTKTVAASAAVHDGLARILGSDTLTSKVRVIENGARLEDRTVRSRRRENVLFIGRPTESKGYPSFLRLVDELSDTGNLSFHANTVSIAPEIEDRRVTYSRCLSDEDLVQLFADSDVIVAPYWRADGLPLALLEALNCGVSVIGFDSPAVAPLLRLHEQLVVPCSTAELVKAVDAWRDRSIDLAEPVAGSVPRLRTQTEKYVALLDALPTTRVSTSGSARGSMRHV